MLAAPAPSRLDGPRLDRPRLVSHAAAPAGVSASPWAVPVDYAPDEGAREEPSEVLRILVVAGDPLARAGLSALIAAVPDCHVVGEIPDDAELPDALERLGPDAVVWDLGERGAAPDQGNLGEAATPVLVLAPRHAPRPSAVPATAAGILPRDANVPTLTAALRAVARGLVVLDPAFAAAAQSRERAPAELTEALTPREIEVLQWLAAGLSNKLIAERLEISEHTVRFHLNAIFGKLDAHTRTEAVSRAIRLGLIVL